MAMVELGRVPVDLYQRVPAGSGRSRRIEIRSSSLDTFLTSSSISYAGDAINFSSDSLFPYPSVQMGVWSWVIWYPWEDPA